MNAESLEPSPCLSSRDFQSSSWLHISGVNLCKQSVSTRYFTHLLAHRLPASLEENRRCNIFTEDKITCSDLPPIFRVHDDTWKTDFSLLDN